MTRRTLVALAVAVLVAVPGSIQAQETPKPEAEKKESAPQGRGPRGVNLRVQLVISRYQGDKKVASLPYTFVVTTGGARARMRMGVDTPVPMAMTPAPEGGKPLTSIQYRTVGTNIDCQAIERDEGRYQLSIGVENSSALPLEKGPTTGPNPPAVETNVTGSPLFRRFDTNLEPWLRDGQSIQTIASTDPVTGEVVKIDVTMNVVR
jgi:hypothetical protein